MDSATRSSTSQARKIPSKFTQNHSNRPPGSQVASSLPDGFGSESTASYYHQHRLGSRNPYYGVFRHAPQQGVHVQKSSNGLMEILSSSEKPSRAMIMTRESFSEEEKYKHRHISIEELQTIPLVHYEETLVLPEECDGNCTICLQLFQNGNILRTLPCGHWFHQNCVDRWLLGTNSGAHCHTNRCPICNTEPSQVTGRREQKQKRKKLCSGIPGSSFSKVGAMLFEHEKTDLSDSQCSSYTDPAEQAETRENGLEMIFMLLMAAEEDEDYTLSEEDDT